MKGARLGGRYEILSEIGRGGMGVVYLAEDSALQRKVAVKVVSPGRMSAEHLERFKREARIVANMDHPAIVGVHDIGEHNESLFLIMPYVRGDNLRAFIVESSLRIGDIVQIGIHVAEALDYSHHLGVIHRDVKPENILITKNDSGDLRVRITDFGLAMVTSDDRLTQSGALVGTVRYFSPEQLFERELDGRADIYSLGTVLYECIYGETPFTGDLQEMLYRIAHEIPVPLEQRGIEIDSELAEIVMNCLQKDPGKRPARAKDVADLLAKYQTKLLKTGKENAMISTPRTVAAVPPRRAVLVGREREWGELQRHLNAAISGECRFVILGGEPGIGKSRLLEELEMLAKARKVQVLHGRFVGEEQGFRYQGFCEAIQEYFRYRVTSVSSPSLDFTDLSADLRAIFPVLGEIGEIKSTSSEDRKSEAIPFPSKPEDQNAVFDLLARSIIRICGSRPLLLLFEEPHTAEASADALQYVVRRIAPTPTMILATYRTTEVSRRHALIRMIGSFEGDSRFDHMVLQPLQFPEHRMFLESLVGTDQLEDALVKKTFEATEGNPYFTRELIQTLMDSGEIHQDEQGKWNLPEDSGTRTAPIPETIQQTIEKRLRDLPLELYESLSIASIMGKRFSFRDLHALSERKENLDDVIEQLIQKGFIEEERIGRGDQLIFSSGMIREALYSALPRSKRKLYHNAYAQYLEKRNAGKPERVFPQLVHHFSKADVPGKVVEYGLKLAQKSLESFSPDEALWAARTVLDFLEADDPQAAVIEADARMIIAGAYRLNSNFDAALKELKDALRILENENEPERSARMIALAAETAWSARKVEEAQDWVEQGLSVARELKNTEILRRLLSLAATLSNLRGQYENARKFLQEMENSVVANTLEETAGVRGGHLLVALPYSIRRMLPVEIQLDEEAEILANVFEQLLKMDAEGNIVPWLCDTWASKEEGKSFVFRIRPGIQMHDGKTLHAADIKRSMEHSIKLAPYQLPAAFAVIQGTQQFLAGDSESVSGIQALSDLELQIRLTESLPLFPALLTELRTAIVREEENRTKQYGTGPFCISKYGTDSLLLERNTNYWRGTSSLVDTLEFRGNLTAVSIGAGFRRGEYDLVRDLLPQDLEEVLRQRPLRATLAEATKKNVYFLLFNTFSPLGSIPDIRHALCGVVRKQDLIRKNIGRFAQPAEGLYPPGISGHDPERRSRPLSIENARSILQKAGISLPLRMKASVHPVFQDRYSSFTSSLFSAWSDLGIEILIETQTMEAFLKSLRNNEGLDLLLGRWIAEYDDPDDFTYTLFHSRRGDRAKYVASTELDKWMEEARSENRPGAREKLYRKIESQLLESRSFFPLFHEIDFRVANPRIQGLTLPVAAS